MREVEFLDKLVEEGDIRPENGLWLQGRFPIWLQLYSLWLQLWLQLMLQLWLQVFLFLLALFFVALLPLRQLKGVHGLLEYACEGTLLWLHGLLSLLSGGLLHKVERASPFAQPFVLVLVLLKHLVQEVPHLVVVLLRVGEHHAEVGGFPSS